MTTFAATDLDWDLRPSQRLARRFAAYLPALMLVFALVISPLLSPSAGYTMTADFEPPSSAAADGSIVLRLYFPLLASLGSLAFLLLRPRFTREEGLLIATLAAFLLYAVISTLWSLGPSVTLSKALYQILICTILVLGIISARDPERVLSGLFWVMVLVVLVNLWSVITKPPGMIGHEGIYGEKNTLGANAGLALFFGLYGLTRGRLITRLAGVFVVLGAIVILLASDSKTALGLAALAPCLAIPMAFLASRAGMPPLISLLIFLATVSGLYGIFSALFGFTYEDVLLTVFGDKTFTGRTHIWAFAWQHIVEHPFLGSGYQGFWDIGAASPKLGAEMPFIRKMAYGHNGFLDLILETGIIGLSLFGLVFGMIFWQARRLIAMKWSSMLLCLTLLTFAFGRNMMESNWFTGAATVSVLFLVVGLLAVGPLPHAEDFDDER